MPGLDFSVPGLVAAAGADPWELARAVTDAHPDTVRFLGETFRARGSDAAEVARSGRQLMTRQRGDTACITSA